MTFLIQLTIWAPLHNLYEEDYEGDGLWNGIDGSPLDLCIIHRFDYRICDRLGLRVFRRKGGHDHHEGGRCVLLAAGYADDHSSGSSSQGNDEAGSARDST